MKKKIFLKRIFHRDRQRLAIFFSRNDYDDNLKMVIRSIPFAVYSSTYRCWYTDDTEELLKLILSSFREIAEVDISEITSDVYSKTEGSAGSGLMQSELPVRSLPVSGKPIAETATDHSTGILPEVKAAGKVIKRARFGPVEFRVYEETGRLSVRFTGLYDRDWIREMNTFGRLTYDKTRKEFLLPWSKMTVDSLSDYFSSLGIEVKVIRTLISEELLQARKSACEEIRGRELNEQARAAIEQVKMNMDEMRYSKKTLESYLPMLELFFRYFSDKEPSAISQKEIAGFIHDFVIGNGYSSSYQNQMISSIKYYYGISGCGTRDVLVTERPRRGRSLPKVFSKDEVRRILNATRNNKHKVLLWMIYSCGLRRSETTNILLTDLDRDRGILHVREGKGKIDRVVPVSDKVWEKIDEYIDGFCPKKYLFEGQHGGRYSVESVYQVFKQALRKAGIKKEVGVHCLRHSYATHLHETGLDIRYIQELLGHKSTKTTEIYTHVSRRNLVAVRSPIEDMDVR